MNNLVPRVESNPRSDVGYAYRWPSRYRLFAKVHMGQWQIAPRAGPENISLHFRRNTACLEASVLHIPEHLGSKSVADTHVIVKPLLSLFDLKGGIRVKRGRYCLPCKPDREQKIPHPPLMHTNWLSNRVFNGENA